MKIPLERIKGALEPFIAILVLIEISLFVLSFLAEHINYFGFSSFIRIHQEFIGYSTLFTVFVFLILLMSHQNRRSLSALVAQNEELRAQIRTTQAQLTKHRDIGEQFRILARQNAECDRSVFNRLVCMIHSSKEEIRQHEISLAIVEGAHNVQDVLDCIAETFSKATGSECAACIQIIEHIEGRDKEEAIIKTIARDQRSEGLRGDAPGQKVRDNSIHLAIFVENKDLVVVEDLQAAANVGSFRTSSTNWSKFYNTVLVAAIPPMTPANEGLTPRATLCIDNRGGGLSAPFCKRLMREFVWRVGVKLYRLNELEKARAVYVRRKLSS